MLVIDSARKSARGTIHEAMMSLDSLRDKLVNGSIDKAVPAALNKFKEIVSKQYDAYDGCPCTSFGRNNVRLV